MFQNLGRELMNKELIREQPILDASTIILVRRDSYGVRILMGQRGASAVFMPNKFVFPGGKLDYLDFDVPLARPLNIQDRALLSVSATKGIGPALAATVIRELWEETGFLVASFYDWKNKLIEGWEVFKTKNLAPNAEPLRFIYRAVTPEGRPRRFDARFFLCEATEIIGDLDNFSEECTELNHLQWINLNDIYRLDLPFITRVVLKEVSEILSSGRNPKGVPYYNNEIADTKFTFLNI